MKNSTKNNRPRGDLGGLFPQFLLGTLFALLFLATGANAQTTWINTAGGNWHDATNWDPADIPNSPGEDGLIPDDGETYTIDLNGQVSLGRIMINNPNLTFNLSGYYLQSTQPEGLSNYGQIIANLGTSQINGPVYNEAGGQIDIRDGATLRKDGDVITNNGVINLNPDQQAGAAILHIFSGASVDGNGEIIMTTAGNPDDAQISSYYTTFTNGADHIIRGDGQISANLDNLGTIRADREGTPLYLVTNAKNNYGLLEATDGAELYISNGAITQSETGVIRADNARVTLNASATIISGQLTTANSGKIEVVGESILQNVTNSGDLDIHAGSNVRLQNGMVNDGQILLHSNSGEADSPIVCYYSPTISGSGEILMQTEGDYNDAAISSYYTTLTHDVDHTIRGGGRISATMVNNGLIRADRPGDPLWLTNDALTNNGIIEAVAGSELIVNASGVIQNTPGAIIADEGLVTLSSTVITGGVLNSFGDGRVKCRETSTLSNVTNQGQLEIPSGRAVAVQNGLTNENQISVHSDVGEGNSSITFYYNPTLSGPGELLMISDGDSEDATLHTYYTTITQAADHTIRGSGTIHATFDNYGTVAADDPGNRLYLSGAKTNHGLMKATDSARLQIVNSTVTQGEDGIIRADNGVVELASSGAVDGGRLETTNNGYFTNLSTGVLANVNNAGLFNVPSNTALRIHHGMVNDGTIVVNSDKTANPATLTAFYNPWLNGTGDLILQGIPEDLNTAQITAYYCTLYQGADHTIRGGGHIQANFSNYGTVIGDDPDSYIYISSSNFYNYGIVAASDSGYVYVNVKTNCESGGVLFSGSWQPGPYSQVYLRNADVWNIDAEVILDGPGSEFLREYNQQSVLTNLAQVDTLGHFEIVAGRDFTSAGALSNRGRLTIGETCSLVVNGTFEQLGTNPPGTGFAGQGWTELNGVLFPATGDTARFNGGTLQGNGTLAADLLSSARTSPGNSIGNLTVAGSFTQTIDGELFIEIGGREDGEYDVLTVTGDARLAGTIWLQTADDFEPVVGDTFQVMTCASRTGEFDLMYGALGEGVLYDVLYYDTHVTVVVTQTFSSTDDEPGELPSETSISAISFSSCLVTGGSVQFQLDLPQASDVTIELFDFSGRRVSTIANQFTNAGAHSYQWHGLSDNSYPVSSGIYFGRARVINEEQSRNYTTRVLYVR